METGERTVTSQSYCLFHIQLAACVLCAAAVLLTTLQNLGRHMGDCTYTAYVFIQTSSSAAIIRITQHCGLSVLPTKFETHNIRVFLLK